MLQPHYINGRYNMFFKLIILVLLALYLVSCFSPLRLEYDSVRYFGIKDCLQFGCPPDSKAANDLLPYGYPVLLMLLSKTGILNSFSIAFINCIYLLAGLYFVKQVMGMAVRSWIFFLLVLLSWAFIKLFAYPLSEMQYVFFSTGSLFFYRQYTQNRKTAPLLLAFAFAALAFFTRTVGVALGAALLIGLVWDNRKGLNNKLRRNRQVFLILSFVIVLLIVMLFIFLKPVGISQYMMALTSGKQNAGSIIDTILGHFREWGQLMLNMPINKARSWLPNGVVNWLFLLTGIGLFAWFAWVLYLRGATVPAIITIYLVLYCCIIFYWPFYDPRFWVPILPFIAAIILQTPLNTSFLKLMGVLLFVFYGLLGGAAVGYSLFTQFNKKDFARIQANGIFRNEYETWFFGKPLSDTATHVNATVLQILKKYH